MKRKAALLAILTEVGLGLALYWSLDHCRALQVLIRVIHAPASGWYFAIDNVLSIPEAYEPVGQAFVFVLQALIWFGLYYSALSRYEKRRAT